MSSVFPGSADAPLFDLRRVVLDIDFSKAIACWSGTCRLPAGSHRRALCADSEAYRLHEVGKISDEA